MNVSTALISVSDKAGLVAFGGGLERLGIEIYSTGKTFKLLAEHLAVHEAGGYDKLPELVGKGTKPRNPKTSSRGDTTLNGPVLRSIADYTGSDEKLNGRLKTLYPNVFEAILTEERDEKQRKLSKSNGSLILDLVVVNFYPFQEAVAKAGVAERNAVEKIDIGGPAMVRSAAKNFRHVVVVVNHEDYPEVLHRIRVRRLNTLSWRREMALKALQYVAEYDTAIANFFARRWGKIKSSLTA